LIKKFKLHFEEDFKAHMWNWSKDNDKVGGDLKGIWKFYGKYLFIVKEIFMI
jgi:hypothetical protein